MAAPDKAPDPQAALAKYKYPDSEKDDAAIKKVETAIQKTFGGSYEKGLADGAPITADEVESKKSQAEQEAKAEEASHPDEVAKEKKEAPPGNLGKGSPTKPSVQAPNPPKGGPTSAKKGAGEAPPKGPGATGKPGGKAGGGGSAKGAPAAAISGAAGAGGDIDKYLNDYPHKSKETTEHFSKIKEMGKVATGFDGQTEKYIQANDGALETAKGAVFNFLGKKDMQAILGDSPYSKIQGNLGTFMSVLSKVNSGLNIVGGICTKLGIVLTVVGLLGMIFPPLGAAVSAVARVLNIVGIICDVVGLAINGILVGLNGVVLAKQIAHGASNEEKAATADLMMQEATSAGGHILNLAMSWGPKFMKGLKGASKGIIGQLFAKFKGVVGKLASKALGPIANWAKNIGFKLGFGLEKSGPGFLSKTAAKVGAAWKSPGKLMEKIKGSNLVAKINANKTFGKIMSGSEKMAAGINNVLDKGKFGKVMGVVEGEGAGAMIGNLGSGTKWAKNLEKAAKDEAKLAIKTAEREAVENEMKRVRAKMEHDIAAKEKAGLADEAKALRDAEAKTIKDAEKTAKTEAKATTSEEKKHTYDESKKAKREASEQEEWKQDPHAFNEKTEDMEKNLEKLKDKQANPNVGAKKKEEAKIKAEGLEKQIESRKMAGVRAGHGEGIETIGGAKESLANFWQGVHGKSEAADKLKERDEAAGKNSGHKANEDFEKKDRHEKIAEWHEHDGPAPTASEHVESLLANLDTNSADQKDPDEHEGDEHEHEHEGDDEKTSSSPDEQTASSNEGPSGPGAEPPQEEKKDAKPESKEPSKEEKPTEVPELAYWPKLLDATGEFATAAKDLARMKQIAFGFQKSQEEAKKKAFDMATTFSKSGENAQKKAEHGQQHQAALQGSTDEAKGSASSADKGSTSADGGAKEQDKGKGTANGPAEKAPDPGEKPSIWHPIARIWYSVKKWASEKAAAVFGWIQDKIASLVLNLICGVSMGDLKAYTAALHHRMEFSKTAGTKGMGEAAKAMGESNKNKTESKTYEQQALDDAKDCDQNIQDATTFVASVEQTEQELVAEKAKAVQFINELHAAVAAEKQKQAAEKKKKEDEAKKAAAPAGPSATGPTPAPTPAPKATAAKKKPEPKKAQVDTAAIGKVANAAGYVQNQAALLVQQITTEKTAQANRLKDAVAKKPAAKAYVAKLTLGDNVIKTVSDVNSEIITSMTQVSGQTPTNKAGLHGMAGKVKSEAKHLDEAQVSAWKSLNFAFKSAYDSAASLDQKHA